MWLAKELNLPQQYMSQDACRLCKYMQINRCKWNPNAAIIPGIGITKTSKPMLSDMPLAEAN